MVKTYNNLYERIIDWKNLILAYRKAIKGKTKKRYILEFEANLRENLLRLQEELKNQTYSPKPLVTFILRDPKTRKISKSDFRDRIVHHSLFQIIEPIFDKSFIYDSCANRKGKGNLFALNRFYEFAKEISENGKVKNLINNNQIKGYCLKADIKHYFEEVNHKVLMEIIKKKITDERVLWLIEQILVNNSFDKKLIDSSTKGMPLGNLTSQFFANIYLNELDYFVKHKLRAKYYIRYVDDFIVLHKSKEQLKIWKLEIDKFLREKLKLELHPQKSKICSLSRGIDFVGFRCFWHYKLLRKRNIRKMLFSVGRYKNGEVSKEKILEIFQGWNAYAEWANSLGLRRMVISNMYSEPIQILL